MHHFFTGVKRIKVDKLKRNSDTKLYELDFGNGQRFEFTSKRNGTKFCNSVGAFFSLKLLEIIKIYIEVHSEFYRLWFYFDTIHYQKQYLGLNLFRGFEKKLDNFSRETALPNGNYYIYHNFDYLIGQLLGVVDLIAELHKKRSNQLELKYNTFWVARLNGLKNELEDLKELKQPKFEKRINSVLQVA